MSNKPINFEAQNFREPFFPIGNWILEIGYWVIS